jgi:PadR family transcriptional regulator AphA
MSSDQLSLFSYEILGLVGRQGASAHDLLRMAQRGRMLAWAGESQYYTEPKRLAKLGFLAARKEPGKTRERTVYTLTEQGQKHSASTHAPPSPSRRSGASRWSAC